MSKFFDKGKKKLYQYGAVSVAVIVSLVLLFYAYVGIGIYKYENTFTPIPDSLENLERSDICILYAFDVNDKEKMVGFCDYMFVAKIESVTGTKYDDVSFRWRSGGFVGTAYTHYEISVLENIKGSLVTDKAIPVSEWGGITINSKGYQVHLPYSAGGYYIFLCNAQQDGNLSIVDAAHLGFSPDYSSASVDAYKQAFINQDESERTGERYTSVYEDLNETNVSIPKSNDESIYVIENETTKNRTTETSENTELIDVELLLEKCVTLGDFSKSISASDSDVNVNGYFAVNDFVYYKQEGKEDIIHSIGYDGWMLPAELIDECSDVKAETRNNATGEMLCFDITVSSQKGLLYLCNDGYLYISFNSVTKAFNIGIDNYNEFMRDFDGVSCLWTEENPVTIG